MSRLDDELKLAFRREPAPTDFTDRVIQRVRLERRPSVVQQSSGWWRQLIRWFDTRNLRLVQVGAVALLLIALLAVAYRISHVTPPAETAVDNPGVQSKPEPIPLTPVTPVPSVSPDLSVVPVRTPTTQPPRIRHIQNAPSSEAEAAKEQVMLALQIASSTIGDAQRSVQEGEEFAKSK